MHYKLARRCSALQLNGNENCSRKFWSSVTWPQRSMCRGGFLIRRPRAQVSKGLQTRSRELPAFPSNTHFVLALSFCLPLTPLRSRYFAFILRKKDHWPAAHWSAMAPFCQIIKIVANILKLILLLVAQYGDIQFCFGPLLRLFDITSLKWIISAVPQENCLPKWHLDHVAFEMISCHPVP